jgi:hypothetical protein
MSCSVEVLARGGGVYQSAKAIPKTNITMAGRYTSQCTPVTAISVPNRLSHEEPDECCAIIDKKDADLGARSSYRIGSCCFNPAHTNQDCGI